VEEHGSLEPSGEPSARPALVDDPAAWRALSSDGRTEVVWRPEGGELPCNQHFDLELVLLRDGAPVEAAELFVRANMPEHGHGMNVEPRAFRRADGAYRVRGLLLHMDGYWELEVHVIELDGSHGVTFSLNVG
jgi:hypothetical protein